jgi:LAO/AO transport system kinase
LSISNINGSDTGIPGVDLSQLRAGDRIAVARAITAIENELKGSRDLLQAIYPLTGTCYRIGITGPPGAGKSTMTNRLAQLYRSEGKTVGIIAVDPTSPFTGGALLGDRVRMSEVELDAGVFIRSMASRGSLGGLSKKAVEAADVLDASGKDVVLLETVGVGQSELDIAGAADTTIVVLVPESGDSIQAMKAGLMEIADFFVLNKADRAGADQAVQAIQMILHFRKRDGWTPDVLKTIANEGAGITEVSAKIGDHREFLERTGGLKARRTGRLEDRVRTLVGETLRSDFWTEERKALLGRKIREVVEMQLTPYDLARALISDFRHE